MNKLNERFTDIADKISEGMGYWWVFLLSVIAVAVWLFSGPVFHFSDTWQLIINTPTTILEMWIGFLLAAAANRSEKRTKDILELIKENQKQELEQLQNDHKILLEEYEILKKENQILKKV